MLSFLTIRIRTTHSILYEKGEFMKKKNISYDKIKTMQNTKKQFKFFPLDEQPPITISYFILQILL